ncbi:MAG: hypothetical protein KDE27_10815, partial [Planctomycetes bacterium]|nr:hypothetical protein [Planctomycetota bacterium]
ALVADPYRKLAAVGLATALWYFLNAQITREDNVTLKLTHAGMATQPLQRLQVVLGDAGVVGTRFLANGEKCDSVKVTFRGQSADVDRVRRDEMQLQVDFSGRYTDWSAQPYVEFDADDVLLPSRLRGLAIRMDPPLIRLEVDTLETYQLRLQAKNHVEPQVDDSELQNRLRWEAAKFEPDSPTFAGPSRAIERLKQAIANGIKPFRVTIAASSERDFVTAPLQPTSAVEGLDVETITLKIPVAPKTERFLLKVPLKIDDEALPATLQDKYVLGDEHGKLREVWINAGGEMLNTLRVLKQQPEQLDEWARNNLRLIVLLTPADTAVTNDKSLVREATLVLFGQLRQRGVETSDYALADAVYVTLHRRP